MKVFGKAAAFAAAFSLLLAFVGCSNASGGGSTATDSVDPNNANASKILDLRIKKNGVVYGSGASASVSANVSKSLAANGVSFANAASSEQLPGDGYDEKLWTTDRYQTSHVKVENVEGGIKFTITRPAGDYFDPNYLIREQNERYEYVGANAGDYVKDGYKYVGAGKGDYSIVGEKYGWVGDGKGEYAFDGYEYAGQGKGNYVFTGKYSYVASNDGDYIGGIGGAYEYAGESNGMYKKTVDAPNYYYEYVGAGNGNLNFKSELISSNFYPFEDVGEGNGSYKKVDGYRMEGVIWDSENNKYTGDYDIRYEYVGAGNGDRKKEPIYAYSLKGGDYKEKFKYVGQGNGNTNKFPDYDWVGDNNGDYVKIYKNVGTGHGDHIKKTDKIYGGECWTCIERHEMINEKNERTMRAGVIIDNSVDVWTCLYPLCEPGERYVFEVELQPEDSSDHRELIKQEWLSIVAENGVGDIDYSNLNEARHLELTYDGEKPTSTVTNFIPPENVNNLYSRIEYFAGTKEWATGTTYWLAGYNQDASNPVFDKDPCMEDVKSWAKPEEVELYRASRCFNATLKSLGKKQFFSEQFFTFQVTEAQGISEFRTINLQSEFAYTEQ